MIIRKIYYYIWVVFFLLKNYRVNCAGEYILYFLLIREENGKNRSIYGKFLIYHIYYDFLPESSPYESKRFMIEYVPQLPMSFDMVSLGMTIMNLLSDYCDEVGERVKKVLEIARISRKKKSLNNLDFDTYNTYNTVLQNEG